MEIFDPFVPWLSQEIIIVYHLENSILRKDRNTFCFSWHTQSLIQRILHPPFFPKYAPYDRLKIVVL